MFDSEDISKYIRYHIDIDLLEVPGYINPDDMCQGRHEAWMG